jgi:Flp pilus assembly CpaE family ATPase
MDLPAAATVLGRNPDVVIPHSDSLDRAANAGRPLATSDPSDPIVADIRVLADSIRIAVPA